MARDLNDLVDLLNEQQCKLAFLTDVFSQDEIRTFRFSEDGMTGFFFILREMETMISHVANELWQEKEVKE